MNHHKKKASLVPLISEKDIPSNDEVDEAYFRPNTASDPSLCHSPKLLTRRSGPKGDKAVYVVDRDLSWWDTWLKLFDFHIPVNPLYDPVLILRVCDNHLNCTAALYLVVRNLASPEN